jgi:hypothetical protein
LLPLGFGWSLCIHLFVQYPKAVSAVMLAAALSNVPLEQTGIGTGQQSVGRILICTVAADALPGFCTDQSIENGRLDTSP